MTKKVLNKLISYSYNKNTLNPKNVNNIASRLNRSDLKQYIKALKTQEKKHTVFIEIPENYNDTKDDFKKVFQDKKIVFATDNSLMLGARILDNDRIYEINLKDILNKILSHIEGDYD